MMEWLFSIYVVIAVVAVIVIIGYYFREKWLVASPEESERLSKIDDELRKKEGKWYWSLRRGYNTPACIVAPLIFNQTVL